jgi:hypothetical protein
LNRSFNRSLIDLLPEFFAGAFAQTAQRPPKPPVDGSDGKAKFSGDSS